MGKYPPSELSLDHVHPRSKGGRLTWTNTVCACLNCNLKKGSHTIEDLHRLGMKLRNIPRIPTQHELQLKSKTFRKAQTHPDWENYLI